MKYMGIATPESKTDRYAHCTKALRNSKGVVLAFIDQDFDGHYNPARMVRLVPKKNKHRYQIFKTRFTGTHISSYRRNWSHRNVALFKKAKNGPCIDNILALTCSFLELDGGGHNIMTCQDVLNTCKEYCLPTPSSIIETSPGHFHIRWEYVRHLPWTPKNARWWKAQQKRLIQIFGYFGPDVNACLNPVQFLRNPSQIKPFNFKRRCDVAIHRSRYKSSLGLLQKRLDYAGIPNERLRADTIIRQDLRSRERVKETYAEWGKRLGLSERTIRRALPALIASGDIRLIGFSGNNRHGGRVAEYESLVFLRPHAEIQETLNDCKSTAKTFNSQNGHLERSKTNLSANGLLLSMFIEHGAMEGCRNKTIFACGLYAKWKNGGTISSEKLREMLFAGFMKTGLSEKEFQQTLENVQKVKYQFPLSHNTLREWGLFTAQSNEIYQKGIYLCKNTDKPQTWTH